jgi:hypothetical protein
MQNCSGSASLSPVDHDGKSGFEILVETVLNTGIHGPRLATHPAYLRKSASICGCGFSVF